MEVFNPAENFEPSGEVKKQMAHTPKHFKSIANIAVHGLFSTHRFDKCISALLGIFAIESITLYIFYINAGGSVAFYAVACFAAIDFLLAIASHHNQDEIIIKQNEIAITDDPVLVQGQEKKLRELTFFKKFVFIPLIWAVAVGKSLAFYGNYGALDSIVAFVTALYLLEAFLHVRFTGYVWYVWIYNRKFKKEHDAYVDSDRHQYAYDTSKPRTLLIESSIPLKNARQGKQSLEREGDTNRYILNAFGILTDAELLNLVNDQDTNDQRRVLLKEGIKFQLEILKLDPLSN